MKVKVPGLHLIKHLHLWWYFHLLRTSRWIWINNKEISSIFYSSYWHTFENHVTYNVSSVFITSVGFFFLSNSFQLMKSCPVPSYFFHNKLWLSPSKFSSKYFLLWAFLSCPDHSYPFRFCNLPIPICQIDLNILLLHFYYSPQILPMSLWSKR